MKAYRAELHTHTVLSPCAGVEMIPPLIVREALHLGLNMLAVTDHNATANIAAVMEAARGTGLTVLPGMELQTREEVHLLCLFDTLEQASAWQTRVDEVLPNIVNNTEFFGEQFVVDATGEFIRREERLLINSANIGLALLGLVPAGFDALEISRYIHPRVALERYPQLQGHTLLQSGDVHLLDGFIGAVEFQMEEPSIAEMNRAIKGRDGRKVSITRG